MYCVNGYIIVLGSVCDFLLVCAVVIR